MTPAQASSSLPAPTRIVSLNPCIDAILVELVPLPHIAALSHYSRDPQRSAIAALAQQLPITYETAEEVVALKPDLVLSSRHSALATRNALQRVGIRFELFEVPDSVASSLAQVRQIAALLERRQEGEILVNKIERALAAARPDAAHRPLSAVIYQPGGLSAGAETVTGELMQLTGLQNVAQRYGIRQYRPLPLEMLVSAPPDILLAGSTSSTASMQAERVMHHRALRALQARMTRANYPARLLYCAGPTMIDAVAALVDARKQAARARDGS